MRAILLTWLVVAVALAGCTGDGADGSDGSGTDDGSDPGSSNEDLTLSKATIAGDAEPIVKNFNGAKDPTAGYCSDQSCPRDVYPLYGDMVDGVAYYFEAVVTWPDESPTIDTPVFMLLTYNAGVRDHGGSEYSNTDVKVTATLLARHEPNEVQLEIGWNFGGDNSASYELEYTLTPIPDRVPQYAAAAVTVPEGGALRVEAHDDAGRVLVFDNQDEWIEPVTVQSGEIMAIPMNFTSSQEVVVFALDDIWTSIHVQHPNGSAPPILRHIPIERQEFDFGELAGSGTEELTESLDVPTLRVGYFFGANCVPEDCLVAQNWNLEIFDPEGTSRLIDSGNCELCGGSWADSTHYDDGPSPAGEYTWEWSSDEYRGVEFMGRVWTYVR